MNDVDMENLYNTILAGWAAQRQRLTPSDLREMPKLYAAGLMDLDFDVARAAVIRIVHTSKFLPTVAEIREAAGVVKHGNRRSGGEAWGEVVNKIRTFGLRRDSTSTRGEFFFEDPITERVVNSFGWENLCAGDATQMMSDRARFIETYDKIADAERSDAANSPNMESPMFALRDAPPKKALPAPKPLLSADDRTKALQEVLDEARALNPDVAAALPAPASNVIKFAKRLEVEEVARHEPCECIEEYFPLTWDDLCPNCNGLVSEARRAREGNRR